MTEPFRPKASDYHGPFRYCKETALAALVTLAFCCSSAGSLAAAARQESGGAVTIVRPDRSPWLVRHAASELAKYVGQMTGARVVIRPRMPRLTRGQTVFVLTRDSPDGRLQVVKAEVFEP